MRNLLSAVAVLAILAGSSEHVRADDSQAIAIVDKAIQAAGGAEVLKKYQAVTSKMKGTVHVMGMDIEFTADVAAQGSNQQKVILEFSIDGTKFALTQVLNKDKGWNKLNDMVTDLDGDKLAEVQRAAHEQWLGTLLPLQSKDLQLTLIGESKVEDKPAIGIKATSKVRGDVTMYFDKETHLLVKTEARVKDDMSGQEMNQETIYSGHAAKGAKLPTRLAVKRDGKAFLEAEISEIKAEEKLDESIFEKP